jgi:hypothetical protein
LIGGCVGSGSHSFPTYTELATEISKADGTAKCPLSSVKKGNASLPDRTNHASVRALRLELIPDAPHEAIDIYGIEGVKGRGDLVG